MDSQLCRPDHSQGQKDTNHQARQLGAARFVQDKDKQAGNDDGNNLAELLERLEGADDIAGHASNVGPADQLEYGAIEAKRNKHTNENEDGPEKPRAANVLPDKDNKAGEPRPANIPLRRRGGTGYTLRHEKFPFGKL